MEDGVWLSTSRKRDRRSYNDDWATYEARGSGLSSGGGGGLEMFGGGRPSSSSSSAACRAVQDKNDIMAHGEWVGAPHHNQRPRSHGTMTSGRGGLVPSNCGGNAGNASNSRCVGSRIKRVADHRGAAARVGALPVRDGPTPSILKSDPSFGRGGGWRRSGNEGGPVLGLFQNKEFLASLARPPPITANLPPDMRSTLNDEQCRVVESVLSGHSTFFSGPAGSGKSHVLSTLLNANEHGVGGRDGRPRKIVVTATTGVAACNVGGITIHSFAGIGTGSGSLSDLAKKVMANEYTKGRWREVDVLVIDEISMLSSTFLDKLSFVASRARNDRRPFGGVQLVVCGDFYQLPPIDLRTDGFAFESKCWSEVIRCSVLLTQVFRQRGDATLMNILDEARIGELSTESAEVLRRHATLPSTAFRGSSRNDVEKIIPTLLECRNREVDKANEVEMAKLPGEVYTFQSRDKSVNEAMKAQLKHCQAPPQLDLKVGAQVMLLKNIDLDKGLANGSRGVVVRFQRAKSESEVPTGFKKMDLPVVRFDSVKAVGKGGDDEDDEDLNEFTIYPEEWANKMGDQVVSSRVQIPLRLAWSISVHKSQGMTIPNLAVNLSGVFEFGQAYVALSRATEMKKLTLRGFSDKSFKAHPKVKAFYSFLDKGGVPSPGEVAINKENIASQYGGFYGEQTQSNPYNSGPRNPYFQHMKPGTTVSSNPYRTLSHVPPNPISNSSIPPNLTQVQLARIEENRKRALAIRMKKQNSPSC